jgi:hypothetical protein
MVFGLLRELFDTFRHPDLIEKRDRQLRVYSVEKLVLDLKLPPV